MKKIFHLLLIAGIALILFGVTKSSDGLALLGAVFTATWALMFTFNNPIETGPDDFPPMIF